jgi:hypothetical protein
VKKRSRKLDERKPRKKTADQNKTYHVRALGYCVETTAHRLSKDDVKKVEQWCEREGCSTDEIMGNLEEALDGYNCYSTNLWQSGIVPVLDSVRLVLVDSEENEVLTIKKVGNLRGKTNPNPSLCVGKGQGGDVLVYTEEYKGLVATWILSSNTEPTEADIVVDTDKIMVDGKETEFIDGIRFRGQELERDYDEEDIRGKAAYSVLL